MFFNFTSFLGYCQLLETAHIYYLSSRRRVNTFFDTHLQSSLILVQLPRSLSGDLGLLAKDYGVLLDQCSIHCCLSQSSNFHFADFRGCSPFVCLLKFVFSLMCCLSGWNICLGKARAIAPANMPARDRLWKALLPPPGFLKIKKVGQKIENLVINCLEACYQASLFQSSRFGEAEEEREVQKDCAVEEKYMTLPALCKKQGLIPNWCAFTLVVVGLVINKVFYKSPGWRINSHLFNKPKTCKNWSICFNLDSFEIQPSTREISIYRDSFTKQLHGQWRLLLCLKSRPCKPTRETQFESRYVLKYSNKLNIYVHFICNNSTTYGKRSEVSSLSFCNLSSDTDHNHSTVI